MFIASVWQSMPPLPGQRGASMHKYKCAYRIVVVSARLVNLVCLTFTRTHTQHRLLQQSRVLFALRLSLDKQASQFCFSFTSSSTSNCPLPFVFAILLLLRLLHRLTAMIVYNRANTRFVYITRTFLLMLHSKTIHGRLQFYTWVFQLCLHFSTISHASETEKLH